MNSRRIALEGVTGAGKTTLARRVAAGLGLPHVELDALYWDRSWTLVPPDVFRRRTAAALRGDRWVADGNYPQVRDIVWRRADTLVWLDYPLSVVLWRLVRRTVRRIVTGAELWHGNQLGINDIFRHRRSFLLWALRAYHTRRAASPVALALTRPEYGHLAVVRLRSPRATAAWVSQLQGSTPPDRRGAQVQALCHTHHQPSPAAADGGHAAAVPGPSPIGRAARPGGAPPIDPAARVEGESSRPSHHAGGRAWTG